MSGEPTLPPGGPGRRKRKDREQAQLNKCLNEKRRREQENIYMEELAELISASITDMNNFSNVKPDKCAILQETVNQIRRIQKPEENGGTNSDAAVQQSQVSSSKPSLLCNDVMGPLLLEALDGFLFMVNSQGSVDFVSENVSQYLKYSQDDLLGKSIYNIIHVGDHAQFSNSLVMSMGGVMPWSTGESNAGKSRTFNCRMLIKPAGEESDEVEVKQTQMSQYENMQISAFLQPVPRDKEADNAADSENQSCLVCIARRIGFAERTAAMLGIEQFTTKQDLNGKILDCDTDRGMNPVQNYKYPDFINQNIQEFCHANDMQQLAKHHKEVLKNGSNTSGVYRFKLQENRYVFVQTKSKLFKSPSTSKPEFIMSTHSIVRECDADTELKGSASTSLMKSIIGQSGGKNSRDLLRSLIGQKGLPGTSSTSPMVGPGNSPLQGMSSMGGLGRLLAGVESPDLTSPSTFPSDNMDLNAILDLLPNSSTWETSPGTTNVTYTLAGCTVAVTSSTPATQVSWSSMNAPSGLPLRSQSATGSRSARNSLSGMSVGMPPASPGAGSYKSQRSPGFATPQRSPSFCPSPGGMMGQKSPSLPTTPSPGAALSLHNSTSLMSPQSRCTPASLGAQLTDEDLAIIHNVLLRESSDLPPPSSSSSSSTSSSSVSCTSQEPTSSHSMHPRLSQSCSSEGQPPASPCQAGLGMIGAPSGNSSFEGSAVFDRLEGGSLPGACSKSPLEALHNLQDQGAKDERPNINLLEHIRRLKRIKQADPGGGVPGAQNLFSRAPDRENEKNTRLRDLLLRNEGNASSSQENTDNDMAETSASPNSSSPQVPQSTTSVEPSQEPQIDSSSPAAAIAKDACSKTSKDNQNAILIQLLNQDEESDDEQKDSVFDNKRVSSSDAATPTTVTSTHSSTVCTQKSASVSESSDSEAKRNEAEAKKKSNNVLLKQLLNDPKTEKDAADGDGKSSRLNNELLQKLLREEDDEKPNTLPESSESADPTSTNPAAASSSIDLDIALGMVTSQSMPMDYGNARNRLPSAPVMRQNSLSSMLGNGTPDPNPLNRMLQRGSSIDSVFVSNSPAGIGSNIQDENLHKMLQSLWEKDDVPSVPVPMEQERPAGRISGVKRKSSVLDADSTDGNDHPSTSKPSQKNVLLAQLLSQRASTETVINTQSINASALPQVRLGSSKDVSDKIIDVPMMDRGDIEGQKMKDAKPMATAWDNPRTNPDSPFPGNTKDKDQVGLDASDPLAAVLGATSSSQLDLVDLGSLSSNNESSEAKGGSMDPILSQIIQEATQLQTEFGCNPPAGPTPVPPVPNSTANTTNNAPMQQEEVALFNQLDNLFTNNNLVSELENFLGISAPQPTNNPGAPMDTSDQLAIDAIQKQLMSMESNGSNKQQALASSVPHPNKMAMGGRSGAMGGPGQAGMGSATSSALSSLQASLGNPHSNLALPGANINNNMGLPMDLQQLNMQQQPQMDFGGQPRGRGMDNAGPRFPNQNQGFGMNPNMAMMKHSIIKQRLKLQAVRQQQRMMSPSQGQPQFGGQFRGQFPPQQQQQDRNSGIPENFTELMNTTMAPNVSLQRNQSVPGPMSPQFPQQQQQQQQGMMGMGPNQANRMSPFAGAAALSPGSMPTPNSSANVSRSLQWNARSNPAIMSGGSVLQPNQMNNMGRPTPLSTMNMPGTPGPMGPNGPPFPGDGQFNMPPRQSPPNLMSPGAGNMGQLSPNHAQVMQQNRMMQARQMAMHGGLTSPRTNANPSPFGQDPLLMSPHSTPQKLSPAIGKQLTPPFGQNQQGQRSPGLTSPQLPIAGTGPNMNQDPFSAGLMERKPSMGLQQQQPPQQQQQQPQANNTMNSMNNSTSQYVRQELKAMCNARSQGGQQKTMGPSASQANSMPSNGMQQQAQQQQQSNFLDLDGGLPPEILESINELTRDQQQQPPFGRIGQPQTANLPSSSQMSALAAAAGPLPSSSNSNMGPQSTELIRAEARRRFEQFQQLSTSSAGDKPIMASQPGQMRATNVFRNQLSKQEEAMGLSQPLASLNMPAATNTGASVSGGSKKPKASPGPVNVVQTEPRLPVDDIKPNDHRNSLLQQLLSDNS